MLSSASSTKKGLKTCFRKHFENAFTRFSGVTKTFCFLPEFLSWLKRKRHKCTHSCTQLSLAHPKQGYRIKGKFYYLLAFLGLDSIGKSGLQPGFLRVQSDLLTIRHAFKKVQKDKFLGIWRLVTSGFTCLVGCPKCWKLDSKSLPTKVLDTGTPAGNPLHPPETFWSKLQGTILLSTRVSEFSPKKDYQIRDKGCKLGFLCLVTKSLRKNAYLDSS